MAERMVVLSDMWGSKKGIWITSYLGYLQQYFDIVFYDSRKLAGIENTVCTPEGVYDAFVNGGMDTAVIQLLNNENTESHYLTFCAGGTIAWKAALQGLPMKSLYAISPVDIDENFSKPDCPVSLVYGELEKNIPSKEWAGQMGAKMEVISKFGHELYADEKIIQKVSLDLLESVIKPQAQNI